MLWPLHETLEFIKPHLPGQLITPQSFSKAKIIANLLGDSMSSYYLECRLGADASQVDFLTCATIKGGRTILAGHHSMADLPAYMLENCLWRRLRNFFIRWAESGSCLNGQAPLIWLEFDDIARLSHELPLPGLSVCLDAEFLDVYPRVQHLNRIERQVYQRIAETVLELLGDDSVSFRAQQNLQACFDCLPTGGQLIHISVMSARQPAVLKLYGSVPRHTLEPYLSHLGWGGSMAELTNMLNTFDYFIGENLFIDLTIDNAVSPRLGIAFPYDQIGNLPQPDRQREMLLNKCVELGLCTPEKSHALLSWPGKARETFTDQTWPTRLSRWIDVKIVYQPSFPLEAKGYLGFMPSFSLL